MSPNAYWAYYVDVWKKVAKNFKEIELLNCNLPMFSVLNLNIRLFIYVRKHDCVMSMAGL